MITPELKDKVLNHLINYPGDVKILDYNESQMRFGTTSHLLSLIINQFVTQHLVTGNVYMSAAKLYLTADAYDFYSHGGFTAQEDLLHMNIKKLLFEIDKLEKDLTPNQLETANKIASISGAIATALGLFIAR